MQRDNEQNFLQGAAVLTAAAVITKLIGALFRIPLANILGGVGMSYYVSAYDIFTPIYSMTVTGLGVALSRMVSEYAARQREKCRAVFHAARRIFILIGFGGAVLLAACARGFTSLISNPGAAAAVYAIAPAIIFTCISAAYRGYYQGLANMVPTAAAQVTEAIVKLFAGTALSYGVSSYLMRGYRLTGEVLGVSFDTAEHASVFIMRYAAAGAVFGVTISTAAGAIYIALRYRRLPSAFCGKNDLRAPVGVGLQLIKIAIPISLSTLVVNLTALVDLASVMNCLHRAVENNAAVITGMYAGMIPPEITADLIPEYLYGSYSGLAMSIFNLAPALTAALGVSALPAVTRAWASFDGERLRRTVSSVTRITLLIALPAGVGIFVLPHPLLSLLYPSRLMECAIVAPILRIMGISTILVAVSTPLINMLQAVGCEKLPLYALSAGAAAKLVTNYLLVSRPEINIEGVPYGTLVCYCVIIIVCARQLAEKVGVRPGALAVLLLKPVFCALLCGAAAWLAYGLLPLSGSALTLAAVAAAALIYAASVLLTGALSREDIAMLTQRLCRK